MMGDCCLQWPYRHSQKFVFGDSSLSPFLPSYPFLPYLLSPFLFLPFPSPTLPHSFPSKSSCGIKGSAVSSLRRVRPCCRRIFTHFALSRQHCSRFCAMPMTAVCVLEVGDTVKENPNRLAYCYSVNLGIQGWGGGVLPLVPPGYAYGSCVACSLVQ